MRENKTDRRHFLRNSSMLLAASAIRPYLSFAGTDTKRVALIGTGWYGKSDLFRLMQVAPVNIVGLCDVDAHQLKQAAEMVNARKQQKSLQTFGDYRNMLKETKPDIVLIGTPDHWHALQAIDAIKSGANVYLQKPISRDVMEGEAILAAARKYNRTVQVGTQRRSTPHLVEAKQKIVDAGLLGKVHHVEMCCYYHMRSNAIPPLQPVPDFFDYEMWTGPAPLRPYDGLPHRGWWRAFMEYGNGIMGDMCIHMFDAVRWMLGLGWPKTVFSNGGVYTYKTGKSNIADTQTAVFAYDDLDCVWQHRTWGTPVDPDYPWAYKIYGEKGTLCCDVWKYDFIPNGDGKKLHGDLLWEKEKYPEDLKEPDIELHVASATRRHMLNFIEAIDKGIKPVADIEQGHISTASCIIANLSMQLKRPLSYDPVKRIIINDEEATKLLMRDYRSPWQHPLPDNV
ncbi:MAG TPA: Gfo/Idh/MocA family oxidoreductase [Puia sp.]|nr:Gfo/Idh/MocA family oxidoreductase [Puia sp.]